MMGTKSKSEIQEMKKNDLLNNSSHDLFLTQVKIAWVRLNSAID